jgi:hypothetical protein
MVGAIIRSRMKAWLDWTRLFGSIDRADYCHLGGFSFLCMAATLFDTFFWGDCFTCLGLVCLGISYFITVSKVLWTRDRFCYSPSMFLFLYSPLSQHNRSFGYSSVSTVCGLLARGFVSFMFVLGWIRERASGAMLHWIHHIEPDKRIKKSRLTKAPI